MPGPAVHHLIAKRLIAEIQMNRGLGDSMQPADYAALQAMLADPKNLPYLFVGCHGPDPFFFNTKDLNPTLGKFVEMYHDLTDFLRKFEETLLAAVPQPVLDALEAFDEAANEIIEDSAVLNEIKQTFEDLNKLLDGFLGTLTEALKKYVSDFNLFDLITHPYRDGSKEGEWWWFDAMHYRKSGKFTAAMLEATRDRTSPHHLYALGYLTHVAADTVGHAFVNLWSGGPYRSQAQRHKTGENYQDVLTAQDEASDDYNRAKYHVFYNFNFDGEITDEKPAEGPVMPIGLATFIADTMNRIYQEDADADPDYAKRITASDVDDTYRLWYRFMRGVTETNTIPPPVAYTLTAELREVWDKAMDNLDEAGDLIEGAADTASDLGILSIFLILAALVAASVLAAIAIADAIAGAIATLGTATIRYAACLIYEQVYNAFQTFRLAVALNGLAFPMLEHLGEPRLRQFIDPSQPDPTGVTAAAVVGREPLLRFTTSFLGDPLAAIFSQERHLIYPLTDGEKQTVTVGPGSYLTGRATHPAFGRITLDRTLLPDLVAFQATGGDEDQLTAVIGKRTLGNAMTLTAALYDRWNKDEPLPDFNLDSDRGYGFLCWTQAGNPANEPTVLVTNTSAADPTEVRLTILP